MVEQGDNVAKKPATSNRLRYGAHHLTVLGYEGLRLVDKGLISSVFEAVQSSLNRKVALKVLDPELVDAPGFIERFRRHSAIVGRIDHPNVVGVIGTAQAAISDSDGDPSSSAPVLVMEFVDGPTLRRAMDSADPPIWDDRDRSTEAFRQICAGVAAAHRLDIVHRDLKPESITFDHGSSQWKVGDFDLAYIITRDPDDARWETRTQMTMGTVAYMPPEQRKDAKRVMPSGDVFALGRMLYEIFTGQLPDGVFTAASVLNSGLPASFDGIVNRCLQPSPDKRYQSVEELLGAFNGVFAEPS